MACGSGSVSILWYFFLCSFHLPPSLNLTGQVGTVRSNYPTLFELDCMIHVQVWLFYTQDWQLMVPSNGRNSLMVLLPNTKWTMGESCCLNFRHPSEFGQNFLKCLKKILKICIFLQDELNKISWNQEISWRLPSLELDLQMLLINSRNFYPKLKSQQVFPNPYLHLGPYAPEARILPHSPTYYCQIKCHGSTVAS